jgi:Spy/CpxP family protein refolding chaperone
MNGHRGLLLAVMASALFGATCGVVGSLVIGHVLWRHGPHMGPWGPPPFEHHGSHGGPPLDRLARDLQLTDTQRDHIQAAIERTRLEGRAVRESLRARIERELTPEQRERFRALAPPIPGRHPERGSWPRPDRAEPGEEGEEHP